MDILKGNTMTDQPLWVMDEILLIVFHLYYIKMLDFVNNCISIHLPFLKELFIFPPLHQQSIKINLLRVFCFNVYIAWQPVKSIAK